MTGKLIAGLFSETDLLQDGNQLILSFVLPLLFLGGVVQAPMALAQSAGTFRATGNMTAPRFGHTATLLPDGRVLIAGGNTTCYLGIPGPCLRPDHAEIYDPATGTFTA